MSNIQKIPRIQLTGERSSPLEPIYSLTRVIRESLRIHNVRRDKKKHRKHRHKLKNKNDSNFLQVGNAKRLRSKSVDNAIVEPDDDSYDGTSDIESSRAVASDCGTLLNNNSENGGDKDNDDDNNDVDEQNQDRSQKNALRVRRISSSVDENEIKLLHNKQQPISITIINTDGETIIEKPQTMRQSSVPTKSLTPQSNIRRKSKDDSDVASEAEASSLRKRFSRLLLTIRSNKFSTEQSIKDIEQKNGSMLTLTNINEEFSSTSTDRSSG